MSRWIEILEKLPPDIPPEFTYAVPLSEIGGVQRRIELDADEDTRNALACRFGLVSIDRFQAELRLWHDGTTIRAEGRYTAAVQQSCVVTGDPVAADIAEEIALRFMAEPDFVPDAEIDLSNDDIEMLFHDGRTIDLGEAVAQSLGLALDPFPRSPGADAVLKEAGVLGEQDTGPFAALAALRPKRD
jgi:uncharacterized metal-binding protein YceD (DUF177 family)